jgi:hypothetical protein
LFSGVLKRGVHGIYRQEEELFWRMLLQVLEFPAVLTEKRSLFLLLDVDLKSEDAAWNEE